MRKGPFGEDGSMKHMTMSNLQNIGYVVVSTTCISVQYIATNMEWITLHYVNTTCCTLETTFPNGPFSHSRSQIAKAYSIDIPMGS